MDRYLCKMTLNTPFVERKHKVVPLFFFANNSYKVAKMFELFYDLKTSHSNVVHPQYNLKMEHIWFSEYNISSDLFPHQLNQQQTTVSPLLNLYHTRPPLSQGSCFTFLVLWIHSPPPPSLPVFLLSSPVFCPLSA